MKGKKKKKKKKNSLTYAFLEKIILFVMKRRIEAKLQNNPCDNLQNHFAVTTLHSKIILNLQPSTNKYNNTMGLFRLTSETAFYNDKLT